MSAPTLGRLTPSEWCDQLGARILDADGWAGPDGRPFGDPITRAEFDRRLMRCTIDMTGYPDFHTLPSRVTEQMELPEPEPQPLADWERELLHGNRAGVPFEDLIQWHTETEAGLPASNALVQRLCRAYPHHAPDDVAIRMLAVRLTHTHP